MRQLREREKLVLEEARGLVVVLILFRKRELLQCDLTSRPGVRRLIDHRHPSLSEKRTDDVALVDRSELRPQGGLDSRFEAGFADDLVRLVLGGFPHYTAN